eukprot:g8691.t1
MLPGFSAKYLLRDQSPSPHKGSSFVEYGPIADQQQDIATTATGITPTAAAATGPGRGLVANQSGAGRQPGQGADCPFDLREDSSSPGGSPMKPMAMAVASGMKRKHEEEEQARGWDESEFRTVVWQRIREQQHQLQPNLQHNQEFLRQQQEQQELFRRQQQQLLQLQQQQQQQQQSQRRRQGQRERQDRQDQQDDVLRLRQQQQLLRLQQYQQQQLLHQQHLKQQQQQQQQQHQQPRHRERHSAPNEPSLHPQPASHPASEIRGSLMSARPPTVASSIAPVQRGERGSGSGEERALAPSWIAASPSDSLSAQLDRANRIFHEVYVQAVAEIKSNRKVICTLQRKLAAFRLELHQAKKAAAGSEQNPIDICPIDIDAAPAATAAPTATAAAAALPRPLQHLPSLERQLESIVRPPGGAADADEGAGAGGEAPGATQEGQGPQRNNSNEPPPSPGLPRGDDHEPPGRRPAQHDGVLTMPPEVALGLAVTAVAEARRVGQNPAADGGDNHGDGDGDGDAKLSDTARPEQDQGRGQGALPAAGKTTGGDPGALASSSSSSACAGSSCGLSPLLQVPIAAADASAAIAATPLPVAGTSVGGGGRESTPRGSPSLPPSSDPSSSSSSSSSSSLPEPAGVSGRRKDHGGTGLKMITEASAKLMELEEGRRSQRDNAKALESERKRAKDLEADLKHSRDALQQHATLLAERDSTIAHLSDKVLRVTDENVSLRASLDSATKELACKVEVLRGTRVALGETIRHQYDFQKQQAEQHHRQQQEFRLQLHQQRQHMQNRLENATHGRSHSGGFSGSPSLSTLSTPSNRPAAGEAAGSSSEELPPPAGGGVMQGVEAPRGLRSSVSLDGQKQHQQHQPHQHKQEERRAAIVTPPALLPFHR